jgi:O-antigen/teichoic acid export membrane protein
VLRALSWSTVGTVTAAALVLARTLVLPRLLSPDEFGLFGLAFFALWLVSIFSDPALGRVALSLRFESPEAEHRFLDTAWTFSLVRSLALTILLALAAVPYAAAVHQPRLAPLLAVSATSLLLGCWGNPGTALLFRQYDQRTLAFQRVATEAVSLAVTVVAAAVWHTAWALVLGSLLGPFIGAAFSYVGPKYRPRLAWHREELARGLKQGSSLGIVTALTFVTTQVDNFLVGRALGAAALGTYQLAYRMGSLPIESLHQVVTSAALPSYVRLRDRGTAAVAARLRLTLSACTFLLCAALLPALLLRRELVLLVGGQRWLAAAPLLPPLFLLALLRSTTMQLGTLLFAMERTDLDARAKALEALFFVPCCALLVAKMGSLGAAWAGVLCYLLALGLRARAVRTIMPGEGKALAAAWARLALPALVCAGLGLFAGLEGAPPLLVAPAALAVYVATAFWLDPALPRELRTLRRRPGESLPPPAGSEPPSL